MPKSWQITEARGLQTQGVWALSNSFTITNIDITTHADLIDGLRQNAIDTEDKANLLDTADGVLRTEYAFFRTMNVAIAARLDSEVPDEDPLQRDIDQIRNAPNNRAGIDERTLKTIACWLKVDGIRGSAFPVQPPISIRSTSAADYQARWVGLNLKRQNRETAAGVWRSFNSNLRAADRLLDRLNKAWYKAWKSEFPPGTPEGDALSGVDTEASNARPVVLEIAAIVQQGLSLQVTYVPGTGTHATVLNLQYLVEGVNANFQAVPAIPASGNLIGPFIQGQIVRVRTDVGNSRDHSELSAEQAITIAAPV